MDDFWVPVKGGWVQKSDLDDGSEGEHRYWNEKNDIFDLYFGTMEPSCCLWSRYDVSTVHPNNRWWCDSSEMVAFFHEFAAWASG